jgi:hypothetical protein
MYIDEGKQKFWDTMFSLKRVQKHFTKLTKGKYIYNTNFL